MEFENDSSLQEWTREQPLTILALDPADRAVLRIADERDAIQKKTFTKWVNKHLKKASRHVRDLFEDLRDGHNLISLLEVLTGEHLPRERGVMRFHMLQNVEVALGFLRYKKIKLVNIRPEDIVDGNPKLTLGLIWTIILHFQISDIIVGQEPNVSARDALLRWARRSTARYPGVRVNDFTSSWRDGLAFSALIHRNRPDLIDWRSTRTRRVRERLEHAFYVAEKEYGVTRLLDPEDVDTHEPDEKSLITYISSLYETFPEPPPTHPLFDAEAQRRANEYREHASRLQLWLREKTAIMQDRSLPQTLIEMKKVSTEVVRFRNEEVPPRQRDKQRLAQTFAELERHFESIAEADIETELHIENIERSWDRLMIAADERDRIVTEEIRRLERLQRLAEKVHREMKQTDSRLDELERRVDDESRRLDRMHPMDAKHMADALEQDIRATEHAIQTLFTDVQTLRDGRYAQAPELHKRITKLHQRWVNLRSLFHKKILAPLSSLSFPVEERTVTRHTRTVLETRLVDTNSHFHQLQECTEWCKDKLKQLQEADYGHDLPTVESELGRHQREHKQIDQFHTKVEACAKAKHNFSGDELALYNQHLAQLQKLYAELLATSNNRLSDLDSLIDFVQSATNELVWLNEKEEVEVSRDWSDKNLNLAAVEVYHEHTYGSGFESLMNELEKREIQFTAVQDRGEALVLQHHPATKTIEAYMSAMQGQWAWVLQLTLCLEIHLKHAVAHQQFFKEIKNAEKWIQDRDETMNTEYSVCDFTLDQGETLLRGMQELRDELNAFSENVQRLTETAATIVPLKLRRQPVTRPIPVRAACSYKQGNMVIQKGEECTLHDNSGRVKWRVQNTTGVESQVPGVCFVIPPPDKEALDAVERLRRQFDRSIALWQKKQLRMRQNMIFATIKVVKSWDLAQFVAMGAEQRNAIRRALNEDADKLLAEGDPADPQLRRLRREMDEVNRLFDEFEKRARAEEDSKNASRIFNDQIGSLQTSLDEAERVLKSRLQAPLPRTVDTLEQYVFEHKEFDTRLKSLGPDVEQVRETFRSIALKTPQMKRQLERATEKWDFLWEMSSIYVERLKCVEIVMTGIDDATNTITDFETRLASYGDMPGDRESLQAIHEELLSMQTAVGHQQVVMDQLNDDADNVRRLTEKSRSFSSTRGPHPDVERVEQEVNRLNTRWSNVCGQLVDRLKSCETAYGLLKSYKKSHEAEENWLDESYAKLNSMPSIGERAKEHLEPTKTFLHTVVERAPKIEHVNMNGGRFIREGKIYASRLQRYRDWLLDEVHPSLDGQRQQQHPAASVGGAGALNGVDVVTRELDAMNLRYRGLLDVLYARLKEIAARCPGDIVTLRLVEQMEPKGFRTFRSEFNISSEHHSSYTTTTHYSTQQYVTHTTDKSTTSTTQQRSKDKYDGVDPTVPSQQQQQQPPQHHTKTNGTVTVSPVPTSWGTSMHFSEIRSLKRIHRVNEAIGTSEDIVDAPGIVHPTTGETLTVGDAIRLRVLDVRTGSIVAKGGASVPIDEAARIGLIDPDLAERLLGPCSGAEGSVSLLEAIQRELYDAAERGAYVGETSEKRIKQAVEEKYKLCDETLAKLLEWVSRVESTLASQQVVREHEEELRNQINTMRQLKDELDSHGHAVSQCADQVRQLVLTAGDVLSKDEVGTLEKSGRSLKQRYDRCCDKAERLLRRLASARDELTKFRNELSVFSGWLTKARRTLEEKERSVSDLGKLSSSAESTREFVSDVIAHKADLRFITMAGQKFIDESKEYLTVLNDFRTSLPQRLHHVEPVPSHESAVSQDVSVATQQYRDLLGRANALSDRMSGVGGRQRDYSDAVDKAKRWLREVEPRCNKILSEPVGAEPKIVEDQLNRAKSLNAEFVAQGRLVDNAVQAVGALLRSLEGQLSPTEISQLEQPVTDLENKYKQLSEALAEKCRELDTALVQSQGVQDALDGLVNWLNQAENQFKSQQRPASLNKDRLDEQLHEQRILQSDIDSHRASLDSISVSANDLLATASNARVAKKIESKLADVKSRFDKLLDKSLKRGEFLEEVHVSLTTFTVQVQQFEHWYVEVMESVESRDLTKLPVEEYAIRMQELTNRRDDQSLQFEDTVLKGRTLVGKKDVTDTVPVRDKIKSIETQWKDLNALLDEKHKLSKQRTEQMTAYERLRDQVVVWLTSTETRVSRLEPVAVDVDTLKRQIEELKPIAKEYREYGPTIDKLNDLGNVYDALLRGDRPESPGRRRSQAYSPTKRTSVTASPLRRMSQDGRSPSPTKTYQLTSPVSPGGSSGFSSRRSSQDGFHLEEMSPVQQQLSEINNRYSLLGVRITDRQTELDSTRDELKKHVDALRTLSSFLDKINRQMPKDNVVPASKDDAEKMSKQYKSIVEEMYEKQSLLDSTRSQVKDLLRRKPGALGADRLESDVDDVIVRWKTASDRCKDRIRFLDDIKDMHDTHDGLNGWLNAKERMMTVLGPISSDPRMVQSQVQQVQVLREEFRSQQPQLDHLNAVGDQVLARIPATVPDGQKISDKLSTVRAKWNDLLTKLDGRAESLGAAADTSREFDAGLNRLKDALQGISDNLDDLPMDKDPEDLLRKVENLERQLEGQRPLLADIEAAGAHLMDVLSDPASRAEIQGKLTGVGRQYNALQKKLDHKKAEIEGSLRDGRQLEASCSKTLGWLSEELGGLSERLLVSADRVVLQQQVDHHEPVYRDVMAREHEVIMLLNKGKDVLGKSRASVETMRPLQRDVDKIQTQWDKLKKETVDRHTRLQTCLEHCKKYYRAQESFLPWLRQAEDKLDTLRPTSYKRKHMDQRLRDLQAFRNDVWKKSGEYENNRTLGDGFLSACDVDKDVVKSELGALKQRWDKLNNDLIERTQMIEDASRRIGDFNESIRELEHGVQRCEDSLASHDALGGAAKDPKLLDRIKKLKDDAAKLKAPLSAARNAAGDLASEAGSNGVDASHLVDEVDAIGDRIEDLGAKLDDRWSELQSAAAAVTQFNDRVKMLTHDLTDLENELDAMRPAGRDVKTVRGQIDETETFMRKVSRIADSVTDIVHAGDGLVDSGFAPGDTTQTRQQVDALGRQLQKLDDRSKNRDAELHDTLDRLQNFYEVHTGILDDIEQASDELRKLRPVGSEVDSIRGQQDEFKTFRARVVEPLTQGVTECVRTGQTLVQSAASGVNTTTLEKDLEKLNERWNDLKERMNERERKLDVGLLQSGKFQEALDGFAKWLTDTEEMVANQKPPSADYKVVKAQLQEQKFLKKMLLDRQSSMSSLFTMGNEIAQGADPAERKAIERQLKELIGRFDKLTEGAQQRTLDLEQAMHVAKMFQDKVVPLQEWLDKTEKKIKDMEMVPTDEEKIQQRIREHEKVHDDILNRKPDFSELTEIASNLMSLVGEDEALGLAEKLSEVTDRYTQLVEASDNVGQLLTSSRQGLRHLVLTYQDLVAWMDSMEERLGRYRLLAVHTDKLLEQMDDLADLTEEISTRQTSVDSTVDSGLELMKHISSDEALQLKDKLDSLQRRFNDLTSRSVDLLKHAQEALPLVTQFHNSHNRLVDWMLGAESTLSHAEPREDDIARLELDIQELRPVLENINLVGPQLCQISPGDGAATIEALVTRDNRRFDALVEQIQRRAERIHLSKQRSLEVMTDIDELLDWFRDVDTQIREADPPSAEPDSIRLQLKEHKALNDDVSSQKGRARDVLSAARKVLRESSPMEDTSAIREKTEDLRETMDTVSSLSSDRLGILEQALPLAEHFRETHSGLSAWLDETERQVSALAMPALRPDAIAQQQDRNEMLVQSLNEHRPLLDKLNKTGEALVKLTDPEDGAKIQETVEIDNQRYDALRAELRGRQRALEDALQESSRFSDKLEGMLRALSGAADQVASAEPVAAHPPKIKGQIEENCALAGDLEEREEAYNAVKRAADDVINKAGDRQDPAIKDIKRKLEKLNKLWVDVQRATQDRRHTLDDALDAARKFWEELKTVMATLKELEDSLSSQEPPAVEPAAIQKQQVALQEIRHEMDQTKPEVDQVRTSGQRLMRLCGEPDKPEVKKHIEDLDHAWDNITALYAKREENLIDAMEKAMEFHETLQNLLEFLTQAEDRFEKMGALGSDIETVKKQIAQLRDFKADVDPHMVKVEALNRQAHELSERTSGSDIAAAAAIREPLGAVNARWDALTRAVVDRQRRLEHALLRLGQLQHALEELLVWIKRTDATLDELKPVAGDPQILEVELAKLKVLVNDIQAHQTSVDTLNDAGRQIIETGKGTDEASTTQDKLSTLNRQWRELLQKATDRQCELEAALREAHTFHAEIQDLLGWLAELDGVIAASKPVGGLPETASEQLERFMEVYNELEQNRAKVETVLQQGQEYLKKSSPNAASNLQHNLRTLKQRWDATTARANDKKIKLEIALKEATEFHDALQAFVDWLTNAEKILTNLKPVSRVMEIILTQIEDHKSFQKDVGAHRETMLNLDKKGTHLKYFSQKQDVILIKNLLVSVQHRWERVVSKSAERTRSLDHGYKEAREFHDAYTNLMNWLTETEKNLDELNGTETSNDPEKIKLRLSKHREFQRALSAKQTTYDSTMKAGKALKDKAPKSDEVPLKTQLTDLKNKWTTVCSKSVDRQRKLEEALLFSGQFKDAVQALLEWLTKVEKMLSEEGPVHGDLDTVMALVDQHKNFEQDLNSRGAQMESVTRTGRELEATAGPADAETIRSQLNELNGLWKRVTKLNVVRTERLEEALREAERLHKAVHMLLEWLSDAEMKLRFAGPLPDDEQESRNAIAEHSQFIRELAEKEIEKDATIDLAQRILAKSHPDGAAVIKHWITIIQSRWEEVSTWARQREERLKAHMQGLRDLDDMLEELLAWLQGLENTLTALEAEALPDDVHALETLIDDHKEFMENTANRQTEVDRVCKARQIRTHTKDASARKVSKPKTGSAAKGSQHDLQREPSPDLYGSLDRKQSFKGSRDHLAGTRKGSRTSPARDVASHLDNLPHYGPRFPPKGSKGQEPEFKSQRVKVLWDRWRHVWVMAWERQRRLHEKLMYLQELDKVRNFSWEDWRKRFLKFMNHKKSRLTDLFRKMDKDNNGLIPREDFIDGIIKTKFDTSRLEMNAVADLFDRNNSALIDWKEFIAALRPDWEDRKPPTDADKIHDEVKRLVMLCTCRQKFRVFQVGEGKYRFGDSQKLRLVRILRSTVMVRVGGGWVALDEFLQKNDPCRAKGRTNIELREQFILADGVSQSMTAFKPKTPTQRSSASSLTGSSSAGPITKVRERSSRSVPMGGTMPRTSRSSLSAGTPDSLSGDEGIGGASSTPGYARPLRKGSAPVRSTPTSSRPGSKPNSRPSSRPASRTGSKPPSRHGSTLSLDSTDDATPSKIPISRKTTPASSKLGTSTAGTASARKLTVPNGSSLQRPRTPTGLQSPSTPISRSRTNSMHRASSIPTLTTTTARSRIPVYVGPSDTASTASTGSQSISISFSGGKSQSSTNSTSTSSGTNRPKRSQSSRRSPARTTNNNTPSSKIPKRKSTPCRKKQARTPTTTTPTTSTSKIQRKDSNASDSARARSNSKSEQRAPFRL